MRLFCLILGHAWSPWRFIELLERRALHPYARACTRCAKYQTSPFPW